LHQDAPLTVAADLELGASSPLWRLTRLPAPTAGQAAVHAVAEILPATLLDAIAGRPAAPIGASLAVDVATLTIPGFIEHLSLAGGADLQVSADDVVVTAAAPWLATLQLPEARRGAFAPAVQGLAAGPLELTLDLPAPLHLARQEDGATAMGGVALTLDVADGHRLLDAAMDGTMTIARNAIAVELPTVRALLDLPALGGMPAAQATLTGSAGMIGGRADAELDVALRATRLVASG